MSSDMPLFPTNPTRVKTAPNANTGVTTQSHCCGGSHEDSSGDGGGHAPEHGKAIDPVCGMTVTIATTKHTYEHDGATYYFCNLRCKEKFAAGPERYLDEERKSAGAEKEAAEAAPGTMWTCPMDPEIVQDHPGTCPICGMALEPMGVPPADAGPNPELVDFKRRLMVALPLTIPLLIIAMGGHLGLPIKDWSGASRRSRTALPICGR